MIKVTECRIRGDFYLVHYILIRSNQRGWRKKNNNNQNEYKNEWE